MLCPVQAQSAPTRSQTMELLAAFSGQPVPRGLKRECGQITADPSADLANPGCQYTLGLWLASPINVRTKPEAFGTLIAEAFPAAPASSTSLPLETETPDQAFPGPSREQWADIPCPARGTHNWHWRHCCRSCRKDSTGYDHRLHKCTCHGCAAERGWQFQSAAGW